MTYRADIKILATEPRVQELLNNYYQKAAPSTAGSSGLDLLNPRLYAVRAEPAYRVFDTGVEISESEGRTNIKFDVAIAMYCNETNERVSYCLIPRSSFSKLGLAMGNSIGLIDSDYNGELQANIYTLIHRTFVIQEGTRLFQIVAPSLGKITQVRVVDSLPDTIRGTGGFGSTGA